jgi:putative transposase
MISAEKATGFPVSVACALLGVSRSAFYEWERGAPSDRELTDAWLLEQIKAIHAQHRGVYGWRRIHAELRLAHDVRVSGKRVRRLMRQAGISGLVRRRRGRTTIRVPGVRVADDLVERHFRPQAPNVLWVADMWTPSRRPDPNQLCAPSRPTLPDDFHASGQLPQLPRLPSPDGGPPKTERPESLHPD